MTRTIRRAAMIAALVGAALAVAPIAAAGPNGPEVTVKGTQVPIDESQGLYEMRGSLVGKWAVTEFVPLYQTSSRLVATGKERFDGCHDTNGNGSCQGSEPAGILRFTFVYWATFDPATGGLVRGQCVHPVVGGAGDFSGAKGIIHMRDRPVGDGVRTTYTGTLAYPGSAASARTAAAGRALAGTSKPRSCG